MKRAVLRCGERVVVPAVELAQTPWARMRGYLGREAPAAGHGLWLSPCNAVHTIGMRFALDLVFLDRAGRVVRQVRDVRPGRLVFGGWRAAGVLEVPAGTWPEDSVPPGSILTWAAFPG